MRRPAGSIAILTHSSLYFKTDLGCSMNKRVSAVLLNINGVKLLVFNVYLPCLHSLPEYGTEVEMCCQFIYKTINQSDLCDGCYIIGGEFNFDFTRLTTDIRSSHMGRLYSHLMLSRVSSRLTMIVLSHLRMLMSLTIIMHG